MVIKSHEPSRRVYRIRSLHHPSKGDTGGGIQGTYFPYLPESEPSRSEPQESFAGLGVGVQGLGFRV